MSIKKEDHIIKAAIAYLSRNPGVPLEDIAKHAGISRTTLFRYFPSREKLFQKVILEFDKQIRTELMPILDEDIPAIDMMNRIVEIMIRRNVQFNFLLYEPFVQQDPVNQSVINNALNLLRRLIERLQQENIIRKHINIHWASKALDMLIWSMGECIHDGDVAVNAASEMLVDTFLNGLSDTEGET